MLQDKISDYHFVVKLIMHFIFSVSCYTNALYMEMHNLVSVRGNNITFRCEASRNATGRLEALNESVEIEFSFSPAHSNISHVILGPGELQGKAVLDPSVDKVKYLRTVQSELTITGTTAEDAGSYKCRLIQQNASVSAELYVIGELYFYFNRAFFFKRR